MTFSIQELLDPEAMRNHDKILKRMYKKTVPKKKDVTDLVADITLHKLNNLQKKSKLPKWGIEPKE